jgi:hypothetical protein
MEEASAMLGVTKATGKLIPVCVMNARRKVMGFGIEGRERPRSIHIRSNPAQGRRRRSATM